MKINRRTMLQVAGGTILGLALPKTEAVETRKPIAYIVTADSYKPFMCAGRRVINRAWHVFWAKHPELKEKIDPSSYNWNTNVKIEAFYNINDFPPPALEPLKLHCPLETKKLSDYNEYHCFRTYDIDCAGNIKVIYDKDGGYLVMSYTTLYSFRQNGEISEYAEYKNAWHGAMLVWNSMAERYNTPFSLMDEKSMQALWGLAGDSKVPLYDRITLATTFDRYVVHAADFKQLRDALRETAKWLPSHCHINKQSDDIEKIMELNLKCSDPNLRVIAVGWNATSVVDTWSSGEYRNTYEEDINGQSSEEEEEVPYNLNKHKLHHNLFEEVK